MRDRFSYRTDTTVPTFPDDRPLLVYDGFCGLCARSVQFVLQHDKAGKFRFLAAQSDLGAALYRHYGLDAANYDTFIVIADGEARFASDAALEVARQLGLPWSLSGMAKVLPPTLRDAAYGWIARNRMRFFGRTEACFLPAAEHRGRFLAG